MDSKSLYLRLLTHARPYWRTFALAIAGTAVFSATEPALPALMKPLLDGSFVERDPRMMRLVPLALVGIFIVRGIASFTSTVGMQWVGTKVVTDLREGMFDRLLALPAQYFDDHATGMLISKVTFDANRLTTSATNVLVTLLRDSLAILGLIGLMFYIHWQLALIALLVAPPTALVIAIISRRLRRVSRTVQSRMGDMTHVLEEAITGARVVKIFGGEDYERGRFRRVANRVRQFLMKTVMASALNVPLVQLLAVLGLAVMIYLAALQSASGALTVGEFVAFFGAVAMLLAPLKRLTRVNEELQKGLAAAESVFALIDADPEPDTGTRALARARGALAFDRVGYAYGDGEEVLAGVTLDVPAGRTLALVGPSGAGKSTLVNLIPRFYRPTRGTIRLDGIDIAELRLADLRRQIALVTQEVVLFNDTVAANIAYGTEGADRDEVIRAAEAAHAREFIEQMPEGFDTLIGENGVRLSGGQRQRIAIARALLKDAPILILDEATSALDAESERQIQHALETLKKDRTTLIIAHRLSTVEAADRIVVLDRGRVVEEGTHRELLARGGLYGKLYRSQFAETMAVPGTRARPG